MEVDFNIVQAVDDVVEVLDRDDVDNDEAAKLASSFLQALQESLRVNTSEALDGWCMDNAR